MENSENTLKVKFIVSEDIEGQPIGNNRVRTVVINPIFVMRSKFIPSSLSLAVTILANGITFNEDHTFQITLLNKVTRETIYDTGLNPIQGGTMPQVDNFTFNLQLRNIDFETEGDYRITLYYDDQEYYDEFQVLKVEQ